MESNLMPDITVKHLDELERYTGSFQHGQQFFFAGKSLGLSKIGMNAIRMPPIGSIIRSMTMPQTMRKSFIFLWKVAGLFTQRGRLIRWSVAS